MRSQRFFQPPATPFVAIALQTGRAMGIEVDNSSGSWLYIPTLETFIPPYTIGWSMDFPYAVTSIDVQTPATGPAGQISTAQGTGVTIFLFDDQVGSSPGTPDPSAIGGGSPTPGVPTILNFTPVLDAFAGFLTHISGSNVPLIAPVPGSRIRLLQVDAYYSLDFDSTLDAPATLLIAATSGPGHIVPLILAGIDRPLDTKTFVPGIDYPVGIGLQIAETALWASNNVNVIAQYQLI